ncbi:bifunctional DNA primase/polymerase [Streptomyces sp. JV185]|uniref:bifunctional DNA primase/polymerase n=1 Tax=Streptomyces sp. JV185 TaxID=858638 RepID=UPI002E7A69D5|nr:bifunctional DNA primase/polymerase [Streptomyces sp. JV185]MEE1774507.1 bifunctional DNA primase/polymerase [Streptomyces sp. JV185]
MTQPTPIRREPDNGLPLIDLSGLDLLAHAISAAGRGWHVFPLRPGDKRPALHGESRCTRTGTCANGHAKWEERATTDPDRITSAWTAGTFNIGIATGPSGLVVVDLDMPKPTDPKGTPDGATSLQALCERAGQAIPTTYRVRTASGGHHLYFTAPTGARLGNTAGTLAPLIDTRAWGGYVVAPGSTTAAGAYAVVDPASPVEIPGWLLALLQPVRSTPPKSSLAPAISGTRAAKAALERECDVVRAAPERKGNDTLNRCAFKVGRFVAWGDLARQEVEEAFQGAGEDRGLTAAECRATIRSALDSSLRTARTRDAA